MRKLVVKVTANDIKRGIPKDSCNCAVAKALCRLKHITYYNVDVDGEKVYIKGNVYYPSTDRDSNKLMNMVVNFDDDERRRYCRPTTICLTRDEEVN